MDVRTIIKNAGLNAAIEVSKFADLLHRIAVCSLTPEGTYTLSRMEALNVARVRAEQSSMTPYQVLLLWWQNLTANISPAKLVTLMVHQGVKSYDTPEEYEADKGMMSIMMRRAKHWKQTERQFMAGELKLPRKFQQLQDNGNDATN